MSGAEMELDRNEVVRSCLRHLVAAGGSATTEELYAAVETNMGGARLSPSDRACVREYVDRYAVRTGLVVPPSPDRPGWHITAEGRELLAADERAPGPESSPMSRALEQCVLELMRLIHPRYVWSHHGVDTRRKRGLGLIGTRFPDEDPHGRSPDTIGVQVRLHDPTGAPSDDEWESFLAGCFVRQIDLAIFVTTGCLTGDQRREAKARDIIVIAGAAEIVRIADQYGYPRFEVEAVMPRSSSEPPTHARRSAPN